MKCLSVASTTHHASAIPTLVIGIIMALTGVLNVAKPGWNYKMQRWQFKNKQAFETSDAALRMYRITGAVAVVVGIVLIVIGISKLA